MIKPVGVTTKKKTKLIITGEAILPNSNPSLNHNKLSGASNFEFNKPKIKKIIEIINGQIFKFSSKKVGYIAISKKKIKKTIPKLLFDPTFISSIKTSIH